MNHTNKYNLPQPGSNNIIGILGGSFDPPHVCHQLLALSFLALEPIGELWVIPCANHAFKNKLSSFEHRFNMCTKAFSRISNTKILDIENKLKAPSYTINTLETIKSTYPNFTIMFGLGSDLINNFSSWHRAEEISNLAQIIIFERESYPIINLPKILNSAKTHQGLVLPNTNSTALRHNLANFNLSQPNNFVDQKILEYINTHKLY